MRKIFVALLGASITLPLTILAAKSAEPSAINDHGEIDIQEMTLPFSSLASPEAKQNMIEYTRTMERVRAETRGAPIEVIREKTDEIIFKPTVARLREVFDVDIKEERIGGVLTDVVVPSSGISEANQHRVLINLHGGSNEKGSRFGARAESIPIASLGGYKVVAVDYRLAPEFKFPAASEDVARVYNELLKTYRPENIGIYGCSAGGRLTGQSLAWFQAHDLPRPGAIGVFGWGIGVHLGPADSSYLSMGATIGVAWPEPDRLPEHDYFYTVKDFTDPLVSPELHDEVISKFPPTLVITGTRDFGMSQALHTHTRLTKAGVDTDLHVFEGVPHCAFANIAVMPEVPETQQAWDLIVNFFDEHLGRGAK